MILLTSRSDVEENQGGKIFPLIKSLKKGGFRHFSRFISSETRERGRGENEHGRNGRETIGRERRAHARRVHAQWAAAPVT